LAIELRKTGINVVGDLPWGAHFCYFYETKQDLLDILIPYFKMGLENKEFCLWVISNSELLTVEEATSALRNALPDLDRYIAERSIEVVGHEDWFLSGKTFDPHKVADRFRKKLNEALARGYAGMRVNGSPAWLHDAGPKELHKFEAELDKLFPNERTIASCTYPLATIGADEIFDVVRTHQFAIARRRGKWEIFETPELIQAKQEIQRLNEELEQRVVERTRELAAANEELRRDIAERQQAEDALRQSEERFAAFMDNLPGYAWMKDLEGRYVYINETFLQFRNALGKTDAELWPAEIASTYRANDNQVIQTKNALQTIEPFPRDPEQGWQIVSKFPILDQDGAVVMVAGASVDITERKRAEDAVRKNEEQLRDVIDTIPVIAFISMPDGSNEFTNRSWQEYTGLSVKDTAGWGWESTVHPDDIARHLEKWRAAVSAGTTFDNAARYRGADGQYRWFLVRAVPLRDERGNLLKWYGVLMDIEDRVRAEEALKESEAKLKQAQQLADIGYWERDLIADRITWSEETGRILGLESFSGVPNQAQLYEFIHPDDRQHHQQVLNEALKGSRLFDVEVRFVRPDGSMRFVHIRDEIVRDESGKPIRMFGAVQDVTERRRAEEAVRRSEEHLRLVINTIPVMTWSTRPDGIVDFLNQRWLDYAGLSLEEYVNDPTGPIHPEDIPRVMEKWLAQMAVGEGYEDEMRLRRADGEYRWFMVRTEPLRDESGKIVKWYGVSTDIDDRKRAEEQLKITSEQLRALSARLQSTREEEGTRIAREIHDEVGGALTSLKWDLEETHRILAGPIEPSQLAALREKLHALMKLADTAFSAIRRIASELRPTILDDLGLVAAIEWQTQQFQARTGIVCHCDCSLEKVELSNEQSTAVFRIFQEALTNILRHAQATRVNIKMNKEKSYFVLSVSDNGKGIMNHEKLDQQSLGILGMRERAHLIGGEIEIKGEKEKGTVVVVRVPISGQDRVLKMTR